jgi:hypothetical protein
MAGDAAHPTMKNAGRVEGLRGDCSLMGM